jgi:hypothetical protein
MKIPATILLLGLSALPAAAQDIRGLEMCMAEKQMERRTGCLQANTQFLQQEVIRLKRDTESKLVATGRDLAAAKAEIAALKATLAKLEAELTWLRSKTEPSAKKR